MAAGVEAVVFGEFGVEDDEAAAGGAVLGAAVEEGAAVVVGFGAEGEGEEDGGELELHEDEVREGFVEAAFEPDFHHHWEGHQEPDLDEGLGGQGDLEGFVVKDLSVCA